VENMESTMDEKKKKEASSAVQLDQCPGKKKDACYEDVNDVFI